MILKKLEIHGYGPFSSPITIDIDENVTIFTGQNDVGKSAILRLIRLMYGDAKPNEDDQNIERRSDSNTSWQNDEGVYCKATYVVDDNRAAYLADSRPQSGDEIDIAFKIFSGQKELMSVRRGVNKAEIGVNNQALHQTPKVLYFSGENEIRSSFDFESANDLEKYLLFLAFGENSQEKLLRLKDHNRAALVERGNQLLRTKLNALLPESMGLTFYIALIAQEPLRFAISFGDKHGGITPILQRGTGVRKIVTLLVALAQVQSTNNHICVLLDEPENSLHADSQHKLRAFLEVLGKNTNIQVIYATHSPSMINTLNCKGLRLLERTTNKDGRATTKVQNDPYGNNFYPVRLSLGLNPADSLLYAPITVITEGSTELLSIPFILKRLWDEQIEGFEKVDNLLPQTHFIAGEGNNFERWCNLALSQLSKPIIFVDGEKFRRVNSTEFRRKYPSVPIIHLEQNVEFEDLVDRETYFQALSNNLEVATSNEEFKEWNNSSNLRSEILFTKRVQPFLNDKFPNAYFDKPAVMRKAIELAEISKINLQYFKQLIDAIEREADR